MNTGVFTSFLLVLMGLAVWVGHGIDVGAVYLRPFEMIAGLLVLTHTGRFAAKSVMKSYKFSSLATLLLGMVVISVLFIITSAVLSLGAAVNQSAVLSVIMRYILGIAVITSLVLALPDKRHIKLLTGSLLTGAVLSSLLALAGFFVPHIAEVTMRHGDRAQALLNHPNQFAMLLTACIPLALSGALKTPKRLGPWLTVAVVAAGVAATGSKFNLGLLVVAVALCTFLSAQLPRNYMKRLGLSVGVAACTVLFAAMALLIVQQFSPRTVVTIERLLTEPMNVSAVVTRLETWGTSIELGLMNAWTGVGAANSEYYIPYGHAHNVFIDFLLTMGLPGLGALTLLICLVLLIALHSIWISLARNTLATADRLALIAFPMAAVLYIVANQSSDSFGGTTLPIFWTVLALSLAQLNLMTLPSARLLPISSTSGSEAAQT